VIVAEDDPDLLHLVGAALRGIGYQPVEVRSGAELLDQIGDALITGDPSKRPDMIVSDIRMPGLTGVGILAGIRQQKWNTTVILMTAYADRETREEAYRLGANGFLAKPFEVDDLLALVVNAMPSGGPS
jgi:CheY-like chemotaxis protein